MKKNIIILIVLLLMSTVMNAGKLHIKIYNPGEKAIFPVTSSIIYGDKSAYLIDAQFQKRYAEELVKQIKATKKDLKIIFISHSDPDYYFGLNILHRNFPNARIISTPQTAYLIKVTKNDKQIVWQNKLKTDAPAFLLVPKSVCQIPDLEGNKIVIETHEDDPAHSYVWIPSLKTIVGGVSVSTGSHLWMADTQNKLAIDKWIAQISNMQDLHPLKVVPGHFINPDFSPKVLDDVKSYLIKYKFAVTKFTNPSDIVSFMQIQYPELPGLDALRFGAKVFTGHLHWVSKHPFPAIGNHMIVDFNKFAFDLNFLDDNTMVFTGIKGVANGITDKVHYEAIEITPKVFMVYWHELKTNTNVVHIQDYDKKIVYTNITVSNGSFTNLKGTFIMK